jgi:peptidyl-prolyl cis-trans isomerase B (cyclophilin B)
MKGIKMLKLLISIALGLTAIAGTINAQQKKSSDAPQPQQPSQTTQQPTSKKANSRPAVLKATNSEPFDKASVKAMADQCVKLETDAGVIELEMLPESAPESVRNFLNLVAIKAFDTTVFSRVVPGFVVQGGNIFTREKITPELDKRARRAIPDEPNAIRHVRGIVSMARAETPNSATTNFFILVGEAPHLDGSFAAFGRVTRGMETVDSINKAPVEGDKPVKPVRLARAVLQPCAPPTQTQ